MYVYADVYQNNFFINRDRETKLTHFIGPFWALIPAEPNNDTSIEIFFTKYGNFVPTSVYAESIFVTRINEKKQQTQNTFKYIFIT